MADPGRLGVSRPRFSIHSATILSGWFFRVCIARHARKRSDSASINAVSAFDFRVTAADGDIDS
jgi:hypothetical protein